MNKISAYLLLIVPFFGSLSDAKEQIELKKGQSALFCTNFLSRYSSVVEGAQGYVNSQLLAKDQFVIYNGLGTGVDGQARDILVIQPFSVSAPAIGSLPTDSGQISLCVTITKN